MARGYINNPFLDFGPQIKVFQRSPKESDKNFQIGTIVVDQPNKDTYILTKIHNNKAIWKTLGGATGNFDNINVTNNLTVSSLGAGTLLTDAGGQVSSLAHGSDGQLLIGATGSTPAWANLTAGSGINITNAGNSITIANPGTTETDIQTGDGNTVNPDGTGTTFLLGYDANITTDGATANTAKIRLSDDVSVVSSLTAGTDFTMSSGTFTVNSTANSGQSAYIKTDAGTSETIEIASLQGTGDAVYIHSDSGKVALEAASATSDAISFNTTDAAGGVSFTTGTNGFSVSSSNGAISLTSGTADVNIGTDANDHNITIGDNSGVNTLSLVSGTGNTIMTSTGQTTIDCSSALELNSSGGQINIGNDAVSQNINVGTGAAQRDITIGNTTSASSLTIDCGTGGVDIASSANAHPVTIGSTNSTSSFTAQSGTGSMTFTAGDTFDVNATGNVTIDSSGGTLGIGTDADANNINVGTGAAARTITIGNGTGATSVVLDSGTGNLDLGVNSTDHTTKLGSTTGTSATTIQSGTGAMTFTAGGSFDVNGTGDITLDTSGGIFDVSVSGNVTIDSSGGTIGVGVDNVNQNINIGTSGDRSVTVGNQSGSSSLSLTSDLVQIESSGNVSIESSSSSAASNSITLNAKVGSATLTGQTTASGDQDTFTVTNNEITAGCPIFVTVSNLGANDARMTLEQVKTASGSMQIMTKNNGGAALNGDLIITWAILA